MDVGPSLHPWHKSYLIMAYDSVSVLLNSLGFRLSGKLSILNDTSVG